MAEYHVGCGLAGIYAGTLNRNRKDGYITWRNKSDVTHECCNAVAQYFLQCDKHMSFDYNGKRYVLKVEEVDDSTEKG